jgi:uncharacterized YccA/Bax inhibitor family protein
MASTMTTTTGNPAFGDRYDEAVRTTAEGGTMTVAGTAATTFVLLAVLIAGGAWGWSSAVDPVGVDLGSGYANTTVTIPGGFWLASFGAFAIGIAVAVQPTRARGLSLLYALAEGFVLGAISAMFDAQTEGIVGAAIAGTVAVFLAALVMYVTRIVRPTQRMAFGVAAAIGGLCLLYLFVAVLSIFDWNWLYSEEFRTIGIVVNLLAVVLAALSFTLDFATIERGVEAGAPKFVQWYAAFGLVLTVVWLYITLLRLLALVARNR